MAQTELIDFGEEDQSDPTYAVCYGSGKFSKEKGFFRVEIGARRLVLRTLCVSEYYPKACPRCPNYDADLTFGEKR